jgi:hypothetical protein
VLEPVKLTLVVPPAEDEKTVSLVKVEGDVNVPTPTSHSPSFGEVVL